MIKWMRQHAMQALGTSRKASCKMQEWNWMMLQITWRKNMTTRMSPWNHLKILHSTMTMSCRMRGGGARGRSTKTFNAAILLQATSIASMTATATRTASPSTTNTISISILLHPQLFDADSRDSLAGKWRRPSKRALHRPRPDSQATPP